MKTKHLGVEITRFSGDEDIFISEPFHFSPYPQDTRHMSVALSHDSDNCAYLVSRNGNMVPVFSDNCPDEEIVKWWLGSEERKRLTSEGAPA